jgi:DNA-binding NarL/FixJ family response regulator
MTVEVTEYVPSLDVHAINGDPIRVVIVESNRLDGDALTALVNQQPDMAVVRTVSFVNAVELMSSELIADLAIFDFRINVRAVATAAVDLRRAGWRQPLIVLSELEDDLVVRAAIEAEASAIISRSGTAEDLLRTVRRTAGGVVSIRPELVASMIHRSRLRDDVESRLTHRENQILSLMADGASSRQIASNLNISYLTVRTHVRNLEGKLAARSQLEAVAKAHRLKLLNGDGHPRANGAPSNSGAPTQH